MSKTINTIRVVAIAAMMVAMSGHDCSNSNDNNNNSGSSFFEAWIGASGDQPSNGFSQGHRQEEGM